MAMEPVVLVCDGCGVQIRSTDPDRARGRDCPRCSAPLASAVVKAIGARPTPASPEDDAWRDLPRQSPRRLGIAAGAILATLGAVASLTLREPSPGELSPGARAEARREPAGGGPALVTTPEDRAEVPMPVDAIGERAEEENAEALPDLAPAPAARPASLAIREPGPAGIASIPSPPRDFAGPRRARDEPPPPVPSPDESVAGAPGPPAAGPRRLMVRDARGRAIVAREHGTLKGRMAVVLPDGQIGWPDGQFFTDQPFVPVGIDDLRKSLMDEEFPTSRVVQTAHYLVFYQGTEQFARASADLLEKLHGGLTSALRKHGLPSLRAEFPLVAVIFRTEEDFRANRKVSPDVQAYYEILSNRIYFYEASRRDQDAPEVSALRKPQTVAHEGTHQILHNVGIQPRLSDWPLWLVEGFAEYCSPPRTTRKGVEWAGLGQVNAIHMATISDLDDPMASRVRGGPDAGQVGRDPRTPLVEYLVTRKDLTPTDYALSWALTHYLAGSRLDEFVAYMKRMSRLAPFEDRTPEQQLADFREAFGDASKMDAKVAKYLSRLKVPEGQALPFYAVMYEQPVGPGSIRRAAMVSQSPSVIRQWLDSVPHPRGEPGQWHALPWPSRKRASLAAEQWVRGH